NNPTQDVHGHLRTEMPAQKRRVVRQRTPRYGWGWCMKWGISASAVRLSSGSDLGQPCDVLALTGNLEILDIHRQTAFTFDAHGRMIHESAPNQSPGRRFSFAGCRDGNLAVVRADVPEPVARELVHLVASEPPLANAESEPVHLAEYRDLLQVEVAAVEHYHGLLW